MAATIITWADKITAATSPLPADQKMTAADANEIKAVVNNNASLQKILTGTEGSVPFFNVAGDNLDEDNLELFWDNTLKYMGMGINSGLNSKLHVKSASTENSVQLDDSAGAEVFRVNDDGNVYFRHGETIKNVYFGNTGTKIVTAATGKATMSNFFLQNPELQTPFLGGNQLLSNIKSISIGTVLSSAGATDDILMMNTAVAGAGLGDAAQLYCLDIIAGNAAVHSRTELGDVVKLYAIAGWGVPTGTATRTTFDTTTVTLSQLAERVKALIDDLYAGNIGLLKA